jgi:hypothetical protein
MKSLKKGYLACTVHSQRCTLGTMYHLSASTNFLTEEGQPLNMDSCHETGSIVLVNHSVRAALRLRSESLILVYKVYPWRLSCVLRDTSEFHFCSRLHNT